MKSITIPIYQPYLGGREKTYVSECLDTLAIAKGPFVCRFETEFARFIGTPHAASVCNGTAAIHLALLACGIGPGDEVIVPSLTYIAAVNVIGHVGATPVFADSLPSTWQIDAVDVRRKITSRTKAILAVHLYGQPCDMGQLVAICREHGLFLIEDCAEAFGAAWEDRKVGTFGDISAFSFFGNKTITTGEGGMVVTADSKLLEKACHLRGQGVSPTREYWHDTLAFNFRMNNVSAAIGLAQLEIAQSILAKKRRIAEWYRSKLRGLPLELHQEAEGTTHSFWMCSGLATDAGTRDRLRAHLRSDGIETRPTFNPAHIMPVFYRREHLPVAESIGQRGFNLPSFPALTEDLVDQICHSIQGFYCARAAA